MYVQRRESLPFHEVILRTILTVAGGYEVELDGLRSSFILTFTCGLIVENESTTCRWVGRVEFSMV